MSDRQRIRRNKARKKAAAAAAKARGPPRVTMLSLPAEIIVRIHVLAGNTHLPENQRAILTKAITHTVVNKDVARQIVSRCAARGLHQQPVQILPPHLDGATCKLTGPPRKLMLFLLDEGYLCSGTYRPLLRHAVEHRDHDLVRVLVSVTKAVEIGVVLAAIRLRDLLLVKLLVAHPPRPVRKGQKNGITLCPRLLFAALDRHLIADYLSGVLH
ncbi:uncharacterized protein LOC62_05G007120 [Vanrija pseudolonga]|uniref:Uncharacterized protein n=1 Tax=Vanrija pseudolonga TaxID=143232 RepID=A0AAF0YBD1_9TREE|nr:hypothetical protein LOC62_05G007120 [Vanrija pseudolonga]